MRKIIAVITGGTQCMGLDIVKLLGMLGSNVILTFISDEKAAKKLANKWIVFQK